MRNPYAKLLGECMHNQETGKLQPITVVKFNQNKLTFDVMRLSRIAEDDYVDVTPLSHYDRVICNSNNPCQ